MSALKLPPLSLYIHIPWCVRKCPYCDFNSHGLNERAGEIPESEYTAALIRDLSVDLVYAQGRKLSSIFFGGGTPSLFSPGAIGEILEAAEQFVGFDDDIEITLEANPGAVDSDNFKGYRRAGLNRLSLGIQSFNDEHLKRLGRIHSGEDACQAVLGAREAGFDNINLDLMHGLEGQTLAQADSDLSRALALRPTHLSWYQLTIEPNTAFFHRPPALPREHELYEIHNYGNELLADEGFVQYEVSAYAHDGRRGLHNTNYWQFGDYIGVGAGAQGKITLLDSGKVIRTRKTRRPEGYLARQGNYLADAQWVEEEDLPLEFMMNALRLNQGVPGGYFSERTGLDFEVVADTWRKLEAKGLVTDSENRLRATVKGHYFLDTILAEF